MIYSQVIAKPLAANFFAAELQFRIAYLHHGIPLYWSTPLPDAYPILDWPRFWLLFPFPRVYAY
jgi:hypothetical protein